MSFELDGALIRIQATAEGLETVVQGAVQTLGGMDAAYNKNAQAAQRAAQTAVHAITQGYQRQASAAKAAMAVKTQELDETNQRIAEQQALLASMQQQQEALQSKSWAKNARQEAEQLGKTIAQTERELGKLQAESDKTAQALAKMEDAAATAAEKNATAIEQAVNKATAAAEKAALQEATQAQRAEVSGKAAVTKALSLVARLTSGIQGTNTVARMANTTATTMGAAIATAGKTAGQGVAAGAATAGAGIAAAMPLITGVALAINAVVAVVGHFKDKAEEAAQVKMDNVADMSASIKSLEDLGAEYKELAGKTTLTTAEQARMLELEKELATQHGIVTRGVDGQVTGYGSLAKQINEALAAKRAYMRQDELDTLAYNRKQTFQFMGRPITDESSILKEDTTGMNPYDFAKKYGGIIGQAKDIILADIKAWQPELDQEAQMTMLSFFDSIAQTKPGVATADYFVSQFAGIFGAAYPEIQKLQTEFAAETAGMLDEFGQLPDDKKAAYESAAIGYLNRYAQVFHDFAVQMGIEGDDALDAQNAFGEYMASQMGATQDGAEAWQGFTHAKQQALAIDMGAAAAASAASDESVQAIAAQASAHTAEIEKLAELREALEILRGDRKVSTDEYLAAQKLIQDTYKTDDLAAVDEQLRYQQATAEEMLRLDQERAALKQAELEQQVALLEQQQAEETSLEKKNELALQILALNGQIAALGTVQVIRPVTSETIAPIQQANKELDTLQKRTKEAANTKAIYDGWAKAVKAVKDGTKATAEQKATVQQLMKAWNMTDISQVEKKIADLVKNADADLASLGSGLQTYINGLQGQLDDLADEMRLDPSIDNTAAMAAIQALIDQAIALGVQLDIAMLDTSSNERRGGGGKNKKEQAEEEARREAEAARKAQEDEWQKELDAQLKMLERKKRLGEINTKEEIRQLELILQNYAKTTEQKLAMEDKLFEARARLRDEEINEIDRLNDGIITALRARYEAQKKIEDDRIQASIDGWNKWADESTKAIQAQIDALDELDKQEDREEQRQAKLRKIEKTEQALAYSTDEANSERLQKELNKLREDYAKWERKNAISDEKDRLRAEQEGIRERADAETEALEKQRTELEAQYDKLLAESSLRAEAERMLVKGNQKEILALIGEFAPDYEATGKTLGERLYKGLTAKLGDLTKWFDDLSKKITKVQDQAAEASLAIVDSFSVGGGQRAQQQTTSTAPSVVNVEQKIAFNVPVESPADTARRVAAANEDLGGLLVRA